ncbi:MAG: DUF2382 domain-containing protein [Stenomitos rutilans HA7619-LM2]|jgi:uncharacterized protein (TIGR02271 family)|nr:DUF2382 domain-containing protein [Stenomitos rutilans HA7619-LM2]
MALYKIKDFDPAYRQHFDNQDFLSFDLYNGNEKVGSVNNLLVDEDGSFRYFVINTGLWVFGKKVLLPIGRARISYPEHRIYADNLSRSQVESLPEFDENSTVDYEHEERVRGTYRSGASASSSASNAAVDRSAAIGDAPLENSAHAAAYNRDTYSYDRDPDLYNFNERDQNLKLYQERLIANKTRQKTGEVTVGKHVETETARVSVPVEKERVIIERTAGDNVGTPVDAASADFREGEVARMEVYEEVPDIHKETIVRENVSVRKEIDRDTVEAQEELRREELDVNTQGHPVIDQTPNQRSNKRR